MTQESASVNIQEFVFKPKEKLPPVSRYSLSQMMSLHTNPQVEL